MENTTQLWNNMSHYVIPPVSASLAIIPVFYGFAAKSAQQMGKPIPPMIFSEVVTNGLKASPTIGSIVGLQMIAQNAVEKKLTKQSPNTDNPNVSQMFISALVVGGISAPLLAAFNGQTMGQSVIESLENFSLNQGGAIVLRETFFVFSLSISGPVSNAMKTVCGDNKAVEYGSVFSSGAIGSLIGHPADTALTLWQKNMRITHLSQLTRGAPMRALTTGGFASGYHFVKNIFDSHR